MDRGNYRGLKMTDQVMKTLEHVLEDHIRAMVNIDAMQFGFMPGRGTKEAIFITRKIQEKYLPHKKPLCFAFVDLKNTFNQIPRKVFRWAIPSLGV